MSSELRRLLHVVFAAAAILTANGAYLLGIRVLQALSGRSYQNPFYFWMVLLHIAAGLAVVGPFFLFALGHFRSARTIPNPRAVRAGQVVLAAAAVSIASGALLLVNFGRTWHSIAYWAHVLAPVAIAAAYVRHRLAGRPVAWRAARAWGAGIVACAAALFALHGHDPRTWRRRPRAGEEAPFGPSLARTATGGHIPAEVLMADEYCRSCHPDAYEGWLHSVHRFSSFNNPLYRFSVRETRSVALERDGHAKAVRWCAGCHDPVPLFSGRLDDPNYDDEKDPTAHAGITCVSCHSIASVNSTRGNADYTIEEPLHYPFAFSRNPFLRWINERLIKANPTFHKQTFLKPHHTTAEFCSACHKVHIPYEVNAYKPFLRGQNHYDSYLLSGISGHGARSFYYPDRATPNCAEGCHMPLRDSNDFGNRGGKIHDHLFRGANTGVAELRGDEPTRRTHEAFLKDGKVRIDIFGLREGGAIDGALIAPLRPSIPRLARGRTYLVEVVVRTLGVGHHFTQGTADSNEVWIAIEARSGGRLLGRSGAIDERGRVDPWSHFVNVYMLDRHGNRIDRRNPQDIFVPLYDHQIPPGAAQSVHYRLELAADLSAPVEIAARLRYRKFDRTYMEYVFGRDVAPNLAPVDLCEDRVTLSVEGVEPGAPPQSRDIPEWIRWNDYGIGLLLKGTGGAEKGELRQAEEAFRTVAELGRADGWINLARVYDREGRVSDAAAALAGAIDHPEPGPPWTIAWLSGRIHRQNGHLDAAIADFESVLATRVPERGFDFSLDAEVWNELGSTLFDRSQVSTNPEEDRRRHLERARAAFERTLSIDPENKDAHYNLYLIGAHLGDKEASRRHLELFHRYRPDDNARDRAIAIHRARNPAANKAAQSIVIYELRRDG